MAQLVRAFSLHTTVAGLLPSQGTHKNQPASAHVSGTINRCLCLCLSRAHN